STRPAPACERPALIPSVAVTAPPAYQSQRAAAPAAPPPGKWACQSRRRTGNRPHDEPHSPVHSIIPTAPVTPCQLPPATQESPLPAVPGTSPDSTPFPHIG